MHGEQLFAIIFIIGMFAGVFVIFMAMRQRSQLLEMQHREKMAMIERGQVPVSDSHLVHHQIPGPGGHPHLLRDRPGSFASRSMTFGILLIGLGFGFMSIVGIAAGAPEVGVGIGGAFGVVGVAFIVNSLLSKATPQHPPLYEALPDVPKPPSDPPL